MSADRIVAWLRARYWRRIYREANGATERFKRGAEDARRKRRTQ